MAKRSARPGGANEMVHKWLKSVYEGMPKKKVVKAAEISKEEKKLKEGKILSPKELKAFEKKMKRKPK